MITQTEIRRLQDLRKQIAQLQAKEKSLRQRVLRKHDRFEDTEPGRTKLRELQTLVEPTEYQVINIVKSKRQHVQFEPASSEIYGIYDDDFDEEWD